MKLSDHIFETKRSHHDHLIDAWAYAIAGMEMKMRDEYVLMYVKKCPWWLPQVVYEWILSKVLIMANFQRDRIFTSKPGEPPPESSG